LKSLAEAVLKIRLIVCQKLRGHVTSHAPLGKVIYASSRHSGVPRRQPHRRQA